MGTNNRLLPISGETKRSFKDFSKKKTRKKLLINRCATWRDPEKRPRG